MRSCSAGRQAPEEVKAGIEFPAKRRTWQQYTQALLGSGAFYYVN